MIRRPPSSTLFPYPPPFRSRARQLVAARARRQLQQLDRAAERHPRVGVLLELELQVPRQQHRGGHARVLLAGPLQLELQRSEEHTSELQPPDHLSLPLLLAK